MKALISWGLGYGVITLGVTKGGSTLGYRGVSTLGYYSWLLLLDKRPAGSGRGLSTIGDFPSNFNRRAVPASKLLRKPQLASRS